MFYHLVEYLKGHIDLAGMGLFQYLSFRSCMAAIAAMVISLCLGKRLIRFMQRKQIGEEIRNLGIEGQLQKKGTPTMGGVLIILSILVGVLLFCNLTNIYIQLLLLTTLWLGAMGLIDDILKIRRHNKDGLSERYKLIGQAGLGIIVALCLYFSDDVKVCERVILPDDGTELATGTSTSKNRLIDSKSTKTTIPFFKHNEFDYKWLAPGSEKEKDFLGWLIYMAMVVFVVMAVSNGANLTDGMDGLLSGTSAIIVAALIVFAYLSGNIIYADYLNIMFIPFSGETVVFLSATLGALIGFLWFNSYPAQIFMGDTGSLMLGGLIAVTSIILRKELMIPLLCALFFVESLSVIIQRVHFRRTKKKYGTGRRIFKMTPLHHHFQKEAGSVDALIQRPLQAIPESKIVARFWIATIILAVLSIITLKIR